MSNFKRIAQRLKVDFEDFHSFRAEVSNPKANDPRKRLFAAYDLSLRRIEVAHAHLEALVMAQIDKPDFEARLAKRGERVKTLERQSLVRLTRLFNAYRQDRATVRKTTS